MKLMDFQTTDKLDTYEAQIQGIKSLAEHIGVQTTVTKAIASVDDDGYGIRQESVIQFGGEQLYLYPSRYRGDAVWVVHESSPSDTESHTSYNDMVQVAFLRLISRRVTRELKKGVLTV